MWTRFMDMHSGGGQKLDWSRIYIEAPQEEAIKVFYSEFKRSPLRVTCTCCGEDYSINEEKTLKQVSGMDRKSPVTATTRDPETGLYCNDDPNCGLYLNPGEEPPEGYELLEERVWNRNFLFKKEFIPLDKFVNMDEVKIIYKNQIKNNLPEVPDEGYVWQ